MAKEEKSRRCAGLLVMAKLRSSPVDFSLSAECKGSFTYPGEE